MKMTSHHQPMIINCVSLQELHLEGVRLSQEVFDGIFSSCSLLVKIVLIFCFKNNKDLNTIKVKNLPYLSELTILLNGDRASWEISHLPNLRFFRCNPFNAYTISLRGSRVTELCLRGFITDDQSLDMIKSGFPFLEILTLDMSHWRLPSFSFTCPSLKRLSVLRCPQENKIIDVQVYAPKLLYFCFGGYSMPSLLFPLSTLNQTMFQLSLYLPVDASFFLKLREALTLSTKCDLDITTHNNIRQTPIQDLKTSVPFPPANNVQKLLFQTVTHTNEDECPPERCPFFDAFFMICRPKYVFSKSDSILRHTNHFCKLMLLEKKNKNKTADWSRCLKNVQMRSYQDPGWVPVTNSYATFLLDGAIPFYIRFKLNWR